MGDHARARPRHRAGHLSEAGARRHHTVSDTDGEPHRPYRSETQRASGSEGRAMTAHVAAVVTNTFPAPSIDYAGVSPMLVVFGFAVVGVLLEAFLPARLRSVVQLPVALLGLIGGFIAVVALAGAHRLAAEKAVALDGPTLFLQGTILALAFAGLMLVGERSFDEGGGSFVGQAATVPGTRDERAVPRQRMQTEVYPLLMFAVGGMLLFPAANDLLTMFVALEVLSLPLYLMGGLARRRRLLSQEASLKY